LKKDKLAIILWLVVGLRVSYAQMTELSGQLKSSESVEGIHVINKSRKQFTTTNSVGEFKIHAMLNDTLVFSSLQHKLVSLIISEENIASNSILVNLEPQINALDEVVVGKVLTGDLSSDISNSNAKPKINFYDVGIPGYTGKPKTQSERRLYEADNGKSLAFYGIGFGLNVNKVLNAVSGRTKKLKQRVKLEAVEELLYGIKARLGKDFFKARPLDKDLQMEFFYFCSEDQFFMLRCKDRSDIEIIQFLNQKMNEYLVNRAEEKD